MKIYNLSVVNIVPDIYKESINSIAEIYGCGSNNVGVKLKDSNDQIFWGCHSWWNPDDYAIFSNEELRNQIIPSELITSLEFLYERLVLDGSAQENWKNTLEELELIEIIDEIIL